MFCTSVATADQPKEAYCAPLSIGCSLYLISGLLNPSNNHTPEQPWFRSLLQLAVRHRYQIATPRASLNRFTSSSLLCNSLPRVVPPGYRVGDSIAVPSALEPVE